MWYWILYILIGIVAGYLAGLIMKGRGFGLVVNLIVGLVGGLLGGWLLPKIGLGFGGEIVGPLITATLGAVVLLFVLSLFKK